MPQFRSSPWRGSKSARWSVLVGPLGWRRCRRERAVRVASQTCERLVIRRPHHAAPAQNHAGIKTTPRDWWWLLTPSRLPVLPPRNVLLDKCRYISLWTLREGKWSRTFLFFSPLPSERTVYIDETAALYLFTLINTTTIHHFTFEMRGLSAFVQKCTWNTWH